jgi:hypothetical protein
MAKTLAASGGTPQGANSMTALRQRLAFRIRLVLHSALLPQAHNTQGQGLEAPWESVCNAPRAQPLAEVPWPDGEMPDGFSALAARRKTILVAWDEPSASWSKQIKVPNKVA